MITLDDIVSFSDTWANIPKNSGYWYWSLEHVLVSHTEVTIVI